MKALKNIFTGNLVIASSTILILSGCSSPAITEPTLIPTTQTIPEAATNRPTSSASAEPQAIAFEVCSHLPDWQRPSLDVQTAELSNNPRYGSGIQNEPLSSLFEQFWHGSAIAFTTYGLSARMEPTYLSGAWTAIVEMEQCYGGAKPDALNQGQLAELWLMGHVVQDFQWSGDRYEVTLEPTSTGLQVIQFERLETDDTLPIVGLAPNGTEIPVVRGDW
ncbi:MAG: hypothetical protein AAFX01_05010 [Cyanobacteria bacterium J06638_28]